MAASNDPSQEPGPCASEYIQTRSSGVEPPSSLAEALKQLIDIQGERALTYTLFDEGYQEYIQSGPEYNFVLYRNLVHHVTLIFKDLSEQVNKLAERIAEYRRDELAQLVRRMQELEKEKLQLTAEYHIEGQKFLDAGNDDDTRISELKKRIGQIAVEVSDILDQFKDEME